MCKKKEMPNATAKNIAAPKDGYCYFVVRSGSGERLVVGHSHNCTVLHKHRMAHNHFCLEWR